MGTEQVLNQKSLLCLQVSLKKMRITMGIKSGISSIDK